MRIFLGSDIIGNQKIFSIAVEQVNATHTGADKIYIGESATLNFVATTGHTLPSTISVEGAEYTWNQSSGELVLSNPTKNVLVQITAI